MRESERDGERQRERGRGGSLQTPIFPCLGFGGGSRICAWRSGHQVFSRATEKMVL